MSDGARCHYCRKVPCVCGEPSSLPPGAELEPKSADPLDTLRAMAEEHGKALRRIEAKLEKLMQAVERLDKNF